MVAAGGTGGHVYPAIAVGHEIRAMAPDCRVAFMGTSSGIEARLVPAEGFEFFGVSSGPWRRGHPMTMISGAARAARGSLEARSILKEQGVNVVFSTGGYVSLPVLSAAVTSGIPIVLHEPNYVPGLVMRLFARAAARITVASPEAGAFFPKTKVRVTGVPVRKSLLAKDRAGARSRLDLGQEDFVVLVLGGSQGAVSINGAVVSALPILEKSGRPVSVVWICGEKSVKNCGPAASGSRLKVRLFPYLDDMRSALWASDVVVARAGASTAAEILALGLPSVLIPYPHAAGNHQLRNAESLAQAGAAKVILEARLSGASLAAEILELAGSPETLKTLADRAGSLGRPGAAREVAEEILALASRTKPC